MRSVDCTTTGGSSRYVKGYEQVWNVPVRGEDDRHFFRDDGNLRNITGVEPAGRQSVSSSSASSTSAISSYRREVYSVSPVRAAESGIRAQSFSIARPCEFSARHAPAKAPIALRCRYSLTWT